ncbi:MAG: MAPEG family protein [Pseudomonadales bacterium]
MTATAHALLGFTAWSLLLVLCIGLFRLYRTASTGKQPNTYLPSGEDLPGLGARLTRAHANTYEFLPAAGAVMLYAIATGQTGVTDGLANYLLGARILQSLIHIASTSVPAVFARFLFFAAQVGIVAWWVYLFLSAG